MEKLKKVISQSKKILIIIAVLWVILAIVLVSPISCSISEANVTGTFDLNIFLSNVVTNIISFTSVTKVFGAEYIGTFMSCLVYYTIAFVIFSIIGFIKSKPKSDYHNIEHGSSDWSEHGEQYRILSKNKGLILAEENCLPLDKRGNINTLIVGRFRFW